MRTTHCHRCHEAVWFAETAKGKTIPVNTWATNKGKLWPLDPTANKPLVIFIKKDDPETTPPPGAKLYLSHLVTCRKKRS